MLRQLGFVAICTLVSLGVTTTNAEEPATATFSMYCYWTGEATLGQVDGVIASRIGHWGGAEIVQVDYDPNRTDLEELTKALEKRRSLYAVVVDEAADKERAKAKLGKRSIEVFNGRPRFIEPKHSLRTRHPELLELDLTESQKIALNSWSYYGGSMPDVLTDEQRRQHRSSKR